MLKAALIGTGLIATQKHLPAWRRMQKSVEVVALCDVDAVRGGEVARQFEVPKVYDDVQAMLDAERPEVVDICTPPRTHAPLAVQSLKSGAHVLIEKPMAVSTEECDQIIAAAKESQRQICVAHSDLFYPSFMKMRELVKAGAVGEFRGMQIFLSTPMDYITSKPDHWAHKLPGGVLGETGPHIVYMTLAFINPIKGVQVHAQKLLAEYPWSPFEDYRLILSGERATSSVTLAYTTNQWAAQVEVWGSEGIIRADLESQSVIRHDRTGLTPTTIGLSTLKGAAQMTKGILATGTQFMMGRFQPTHDLLIQQFCESIQKGTPPPVSAQEGRESIRVMNLIAEQLQAATV